MKDVYPYEPLPLDQLETRLAEDTIDVVILNTCGPFGCAYGRCELIAGDAQFWYNVQPVRTAILKSAADIVCIPHEIERFFHDENREHLETFVPRLTVATLAEHAQDVVGADLSSWGFFNVSVAHFVPVSFELDEIRILATC